MRRFTAIEKVARSMAGVDRSQRLNHNLSAEALESRAWNVRFLHPTLGFGRQRAGLPHAVA